jgi:hypothetical protein
MEWEYRMELVGGAEHTWRRESVEVLEPLGREGWEAVSMVPWGYGHEGDFMVLFKRPIADRAQAPGPPERA